MKSLYRERFFRLASLWRSDHLSGATQFETDQIDRLLVTDHDRAPTHSLGRTDHRDDDRGCQVLQASSNHFRGFKGPPPDV